MWSHRFARRGIPALLSFCLVLSSCSGGTGSDPSASQLPTANDMTSPATSTPATSSPATTDTPTGTSPSQQTAALTLFYVAVGDDGVAGPEIGCGDSIIATYTGEKTFSDQLAAAMTSLLADKQDTHGESGLRNALSASDLTYVSAQVADDTVTVDLSGLVVSGGVCDDPRIVEQLKYTAMTAAAW
ncbi:hypothetical protein [Glutamicibacter arilaitensis]|uniref:hypothetical protein n=1 Tax=Glutamicibacter arilaitensis TaxID=256701 RepID=UPI003F935AA8